ncbi:CBS domain-containing protein [Candidatus Woesearchaeota archaeon]|nr:CBS domain-containing protein [Candidatus Woesearchaeota archaeon]
MIPHTLEEIKKLRRKCHLTQKQLANHSGVSQSLIAKIEANTAEPSFSNAQRIFEALESMQEKKEVKAKELMQKKLFTADSKDTLKQVIKIIKEKGISQMPVLSQGKVCGLLTEAGILQHLAEHQEKISFLKAEQVMEEAPPIVSPNTGQRMLLELLKNFPVVLVAEKGELQGIVSKSDVLGRME